MNDEIKLCPFCGSADIALWEEDIAPNARESSWMYYYFCMSCDSVAGYGRCDNEEAAREYWQRRAAP